MALSRPRCWPAARCPCCWCAKHHPRHPPRRTEPRWQALRWPGCCGSATCFAKLQRNSHAASVFHHQRRASSHPNRACTQHPDVCADACRQKNFCFAVFFGIMAVFSEISRKVQGCAECFSTGAARAFGPLLQHSIIPKGIPHGHETYLSTVQNPSRTHARLSGSHENPRRPRRYQRSPRQRPQASGCLIAIAFFVTARAAGRCCSNVHLSWQLFAHAFRFCSLVCAAKCAAVWRRDAAGAGDCA